MRPFALGSWLFTACASAPVADVHPVASARATLQRMVRQQELPGAQYVAVSTTDTLCDLHVGLADVGGERTLERDTLILSYSITKALTALAVLQLVERGVLALDAPLSDYVPEHPYGAGVTIRTLLAHTSGVPNPMPLDWFALEGEPFDRDEKLRTELADHPKLRAEPGAKYLYTNLGYWLLERAIEAASGQDYAAYLHASVFAPVGVAAPQASFELPAAERAARGYTRQMHPLTLALWALTPNRYWDGASQGWSRAARVVPHGRAYGGLHTTASALALVLQDLLRTDSRLLSTAGKAQLFEAQRTRDGKPLAHALGWVIGELDGVRYYGKQGGGLGSHGNVRIYPELGLATVLLANRTELAPGPIDARSDALDRGFVRASHTYATVR